MRQKNVLMEIWNVHGGWNPSWMNDPNSHAMNLMLVEKI